MNRERWLLLMAILLFAGVAVYRLSPGGRVVARRPAPEGIVNSPSLPSSATGGGSQQAARVSVQSGSADGDTLWGRNPFLTEEEAAAGRGRAKEEGLQVKAIIMGKPRAVATIDGHTVAVGERVGDETVSEIRPDAIVLDRDGRKRMLRIKEPSVAIEVKEKGNEERKNLQR